VKIDFLTLFPKQIETFLQEGVFRIAQEKGLVEYKVHNLRDWGLTARKNVDERPFGGGPGMILRIEPIDKALSELKKKDTKVIVTSAKGKLLQQETLKELSSKSDHYIIIAGHYEGIDERVIENYADYEISIGKYVLSGGELPSLIIADGITRLIDGVLGNEDSAKDESYSVTEGVEANETEYPQYTRPAEYKGMKVPDVLLQGNHAEIEKWRQNKKK